MSRLPWTPILIVTLSGAGVSAKTVSLEQCLQAASQKSPQAIEGLLREKVAEANYRQSLRGRLPGLYGIGTFEKSDTPETQLPDANQALIRLEQSAFPFSSQWLEKNQRQLELESARFSKIESKMDVDLLVKETYYSVLRDQDVLNNMDRAEEQYKKLLDSVVPRYSVGRVPPFDLVKVKSSLSDLSRTRDITNAQLSAEKTQLALMIGDNDPRALTLEDIRDLPPLPSSNSVDWNPSLMTLTKDVEAQRVGLQAARYLRLPALSGHVDYGYSGQTFETQTVGWAVGLALRLPLFDWGLISSQIDAQEARLLLAKNNISLKKQELFTDLDRSRNLAQANLDDRKRLEGLLPQARKSAEAAADRYRRGGVGILEATEAISVWLDTLNNDKSAFYSYLAHVAEIQRLQASAGNESESDE